MADRLKLDPNSKAQVDYDYVTALEYGLPPRAAWASVLTAW